VIQEERTGDVPRKLGNRSARRNATPWVAVAVGGALHGAAFPPTGAWPLAFVASTALVAATRGASMRRGALLGWVHATTGAAVAVVPWLVDAARTFFGLGTIPALGIALGVTQLFGAASLALFGATAARLGALPTAPRRILALAAAWSGCELVRSLVLGGAPWDLLGHALAGAPRWIQIADLGGVPAVSFVLAAVGAALAETIVGDARATAGGVATAAVLAGATLGYGELRLRALAGSETASVRIAAIQAGIPNAWRNDPRHVGEALARFETLSRATLAARPDLVVWPENAVSVVPEANARVLATAGGLLAGSDTHLLLGAPRLEPDGPGRVAVFNAAHLFGPDGRIVGTYDKRHLVPFAEYAPAGPPRPGDYTAGHRPGLLPAPLPIGTLICFEAIYPALARELVRDGARILINLSNDAWFDAHGAREQHFAATVFRAVELRRPLVRVANTGVTAQVAATGAVVARLPLDDPATAVFAVTPGDGTTVYLRLGDTVAWFALAAALVAARRARP
jgi:apolipoprotein N-acyltransferase